MTLRGRSSLMRFKLTGLLCLRRTDSTISRVWSVGPFRVGALPLEPRMHQVLIPIVYECVPRFVDTKLSTEPEKRRDEVQDHIPEAVAHDDAPEVLRLEHHDAVEQPDREHEDEVDAVEEEDVERREDCGHVQEAGPFPEALDRALQEDCPEDEVFRWAGRKEDCELCEDEAAQ